MSASAPSDKSPDRPKLAFFRLMLSQAAGKGAEGQTVAGQNWTFRALGYFDSLSIRKLPGTILTPFLEDESNLSLEFPTNYHRRILTAFGPQDLIDSFLDSVHGAAEPGGLMAVMQVKRAREGAHSNFWSQCWKPIAEAQKSGSLHVSLGCFDAADSIELFHERAKAGESADSILGRLFDRVREFRERLMASGTLERTFTTIACINLERFVALAKIETEPAKPAVRALMRLNWTSIDGLERDFQHMAPNQTSPAFSPEEPLFESFGIFDGQSLMSVKNASILLEAHRKPTEHVFPLFLREVDWARTRQLPAPQADRGLGGSQILLDRLKFLIETLRDDRSETRISRLLLHTLNDVLRRFGSLGPRGLIPGSRLLLSSTTYAIERFSLTRPKRPIDSSRFHEDGLLQFLHSTQEELDRRSSFSLPAHTHYYPSAFDAPLKPLGILEMSNRLLGLFLRSYRCMKSTSVVNVVVAGGMIQSSFDPIGRPWFNYPAEVGGGKPYQPQTSQLVRTNNEPRTVGHLADSLFLGWFEHFQATLLLLKENPNYTSFVFCEAARDRRAALMWWVLKTSCPGAADPQWPHFDVIERQVDEDFELRSRKSLKSKATEKWKMAGLGDSTEEERVACLIDSAFGAVGDRAKEFGGDIQWYPQALVAKDREAAAVKATYLSQAEEHADELLATQISQAKVAYAQPFEGKRIDDVVFFGRAARILWPKDETLELGSMIPFLLLFRPTEVHNSTKVKSERCSLNSLAAKVTARVMLEHCLAGRDHNQSPVLRTIVNRWLVSLTALDIWLAIGGGEQVPNVSDHFSILKMVREKAVEIRGLFDSFSSSEKFSPDFKPAVERFRTAIEKVIQPDEYEEPKARIVGAQAKFLVRLLHVYGDFEGQFSSSDLIAPAGLLLKFFRDFFEGAAGNHESIVESVGRLWGLQYAITGDDEEIVKAPGFVSPTYHFESDLRHPAIAKFLDGGKT